MSFTVVIPARYGSSRFPGKPLALIDGKPMIQHVVERAKEAGADIVGGEDFIEKIKEGNLNFEKLICTSGMMIKLSKLGKILGPKGLMPNPKLGTVTQDVATAVKNAKSGQIKYKNDNILFKVLFASKKENNFKLGF